MKALPAARWNTSTRRATLLLLWVVTALLALRLALVAVDVARLPTDGFAAYHTAARLLASGTPVARFYDDAWFGARVAEEAPAVRDIYFVNPPTAALLLLPLADLSYARARAIWVALNAVMLVAAALLIVREAGLRGLLVPAGLSLVLVWQPVYANLHQGQAYILMLLLLTLAWYGYRGRRDAMLGISLGAALLLKTAGLLIVPLLVVQRRWRALAWTVGASAGIGIVALPWIEPAAWYRYALAVLGLAHEPDLAVTAYQSLPGLLRHLTAFDAQWNPAPVINAPIAGRALQALAVAAIVAGCLLVAARSREPRNLTFAAALAATVVLSPVSLDYHYVLLLLPAVIVIAGMRERRGVGTWLLLAIGLVLIGADLPFRSPALGAGIRAILAYPKLYGGLLVCGLALWLDRPRVEVTDEDRTHSSGLQRQ